MKLPLVLGLLVLIGLSSAKAEEETFVAAMPMDCSYRLRDETPQQRRERLPDCYRTSEASAGPRKPLVSQKHDRDNGPSFEAPRSRPIRDTSVNLGLYFLGRYDGSWDSRAAGQGVFHWNDVEFLGKKSSSDLLSINRARLTFVAGNSLSGASIEGNGGIYARIKDSPFYGGASLALLARGHEIHESPRAAPIHEGAYAGNLAGEAGFVLLPRGGLVMVGAEAHGGALHDSRLTGEARPLFGVGVKARVAVNIDDPWIVRVFGESSAGVEYLPQGALSTYNLEAQVGSGMSSVGASVNIRRYKPNDSAQNQTPTEVIAGLRAGVGW